LSDSENRERGAASAQVDPDVQLMLRVKEGDSEAAAMAFTQLILRYQSRILRVLQHIVGSESVAEDLVQDVFLRVWRARKSYQPTAKFTTWVFHIANNVASNSLRDRKRRKEYQVISDDPDHSPIVALDQMAAASTSSMPTRKLDHAERADIVRTAVEALSERQRMALLLCKFEGLSYQEIAESMDLTVQAVKSLLSRARVNLKILLEPYIESGLLPNPDAPVEADS
jgi:RNA polymerase sigma-70 factor (ECF subfamily)